ncbi:hypothetical protein DFH07DRAFT_235594 [Mycena maculata]|uniref:Glycosyltransferase family 1 protein n=1 Tax=Mycena maculata TaxID=230809 RepID=A0AAD7HT90_9AGAR|nr:hypothetical protein DFH07DRAFT_235594 [Mycena maculata]
MSSESNRHLLLVPIPAYGHTRPMCGLAGRLVQERNIVVTLLMAPNWLEQARADIAAQYPSGHEGLRRIRIVSMFDSTETHVFSLFQPLAENFPTTYETLLQGDAIKCATTGSIFPPAPRPSAIIMDLFGIVQLGAARAISGTSVPIFMFIAGNAGSLIRMFGPESMGGFGDLGAKIDAEALRTGKSADEVGEELLAKTEGRVINIPGIPAMFDYESFPQNLPYSDPRTPIQRGGSAMMKACDGILLATSPAYDAASLAAFEGWVKMTLHKPVYAVGPLIHPRHGTNRTWIASPRDAEIKNFLDASQSKYGEKSILFISFGTVYFPTVEEQLDELVDALIDKKFPFILCYASLFAQVSDKLMEKIKASGIGMATRWGPQQFILTHPATGWFLTHCGHGGIIESLASGIPMICWPFDADQPIAAEHVTQNLNVAFHLIEIRTGQGLKPLHSGRVPVGTRAAVGAEFRRTIDECRGKVGIEKRQSVGRIRDELDKAWSDGGSSQLAMRAFLSKHVV